MLLYMANHHIPEGPRRIVCLTEEPTETFYMLGEQDRVVGISAYTVRPPEARQDKPIVSAFVHGHLEKIKALKPDLVIGFSDVQAEWARELIHANLPVLILNQRTLQEIFDVIVQLGSLVGQQKKAQSLVGSYIEGLEAQRARSEKLSLHPRVYFEEWDEPMISGISWVSELIEVAGGQDIFLNQAHGRAARERYVSVEDVSKADPNLILASWCGKKLDPKALRERSGLENVNAIVENRIHEVPAEIILQPGPACLTDGLDYIARIIKDTVAEMT